jgi:hypothetical protein
MPIPTITREQFIEAVEAGVNFAIEAPNFAIDDAQAATLRSFAATHTGPVAFGTFEGKLPNGDTCGCPLTITGLRTEIDHSLRHWFYGPYDRAIEQAIGLTLLTPAADDIEAVEVVA